MKQSMKLKETIEKYLIHVELERFAARETLLKYRECMRTWIVPALGEFDLESLKTDDILAMRKAMLDKRLSAYRQYSVLMCIKGLLKFCREQLKIGILDPSEIRLPNRGKPHVVYLTNGEVSKLLEATSVHTFTGARMRALIELLLGTGMRISEALSLSRKVFDRELDQVEIVGKGKKMREVFISARCRFWVRHYLSKRMDDHPALFITTGSPPSVLKREDISRFFIDLRKKADIDKHVTPHVLRHTFCTNLLHQGVDITQIRDIAGHLDIETTAKYYLGKDNRKLKEAVLSKLNYNLDDSEMIEGVKPRREQPDLRLSHPSHWEGETNENSAHTNV